MGGQSVESVGNVHHGDCPGHLLLVLDQPVSRAQEDPPEQCLQLGSPGTRTLELHLMNGQILKTPWLIAEPLPGVMLMGGRGFVFCWQGVFMEKVVARVQGHA